MVKEYTGRYKGFQIRDVNYLGETLTDSPTIVDAVKQRYYDARQEVKTTECKVVATLYEGSHLEECCYTVGTLEYNAKEPCFEFKSCGLRWLEAHPDEDVENWIIKWCDYKLQELYED